MLDVVKRGRRGIAASVGVTAVLDEVVVRRMVVPGLDFHRRQRCLFAVGRGLLSEFEHFGVVRVDFAEARRDVVPVTTFGQRGESFGQAHQQTSSAVVDGLFEELVDL